MQEVIWIRDSLDRYQVFFAELEEQGGRIDNPRKILRIKGDLEDLARRCRANIGEYEEKLNAEQRDTLAGKMKRHTYRKKIALFKEYEREAEELEKWLKSIACI